MTASLHAQTMSSCCVNLSFFITCWWLQGWNELRPHEEMLVIVYCQVPLPPPVDLRWNSCFPGCLGNTKEKWLGFVTCSSSELLCRLHIRSWSFFFFYCYYLYLFINIFFSFQPGSFVLRVQITKMKRMLWSRLSQTCFLVSLFPWR